VIGIDIEPSQIDVAERKAAELGLHNCAFQAGSVLELPFADVTFDAVFGHTILMQFGNPGPVLREVSRVLKPGGAVGFRETDFGASLAFPRESAQVRAMATLRESILRNNGFPDIGRQLPRLLTDVGFKVERMNATYNASRSPIEMKRRCEWLRRLWDEADFVARAESEGWLSPETRRLIADGLVAETGDMSVFYATTYCEVVARKPK
jgi:ubiquinone/menaquinone biosynthesis C-methylase UbiE